MTLQEKQILLAEFLGFKTFIRGKDTVCIGDYEKDGDKIVKFDSDWNWIMQVVEKIEKLYHLHGVRIEGKWCYIITNKNFDVRAETKLEAVFEACVQFVEWYNKNKLK